MAYSLLLAFLENTHRGNGVDLNLTTAIDYLPRNVPILADLYSLVTRVSKSIPNIHRAVQTLVDQIKNSDIARIYHKLVEHKPGEDPVIQFYEPFLKEYDPKEREARGVYYTPKPIVDFIIRSVDYLLRINFKKENGLANKDVHLLDPATGTGTFLMSAIQKIYFDIKSKYKPLGEEIVLKEFNDITLTHILKNFYGFELMVAPYAIAHLKLTLIIEDLGFNFELTKKDSDPDNDRFKVYLANTLDDPEKPPMTLFGFDAIPEESEKARIVKKETPILAIIGNPPYSKITTNLTSYMRSLIENYKYIAGEKIKEKGALQLEINLNDDYVKFIAFAQRKIDAQGIGVIGFVTNHNFLDNPTLKGMRFSLLSSFSKIFIINLHGNAKKKIFLKELKDQNVFNIAQGVCISFFVKDKKKKTSAELADVFYFDIPPGPRASKFEFLNNISFEKIKFREIKPEAPHYMLVWRDVSKDKEFSAFFPLSKIFPLNSAGIITARDNITIGDSKNELLELVKTFQTSKKSDEELASEVEISLKKGWDISKSRENLMKETDLEKYVYEILYRPFDIRKIFYHSSLVWSMSLPVMRQMFGKKNLSLLFTRQVTSLRWNHVQVSNCLSEIKSNSHDRSSQIAPLYLFPDRTKKQTSFISDEEKTANLDPQFIAELEKGLRLKYIGNGRGNLKQTFGPEDVFYYIYAILHSPEYRIRYAEQLKVDFPRIPLTSEKMIFSTLAQKGEELVNLHLLGENPFYNKRTIFESPAKWNVKVAGQKPENRNDWEVSEVRYDEDSQRVYVNSGQYFEGVEKEVWNFVIGGYQVCEKWLKERKKMNQYLSVEKLKHFMKIVVSLRETIKIMSEIDEFVRVNVGWPIK